ncbi:unnamed protein product [Oikopleura dioica]|uniref:C-type lectin domain-containing protein n=1 Tax=Oikopleura dioica TaxID=34765 RepID=E4Z0D8_OIKDI|nr:unnamed protein product [Oikopleura dioica]
MIEGEWNDNKCDELSAYICEYYLNGSPHPDLPNPSPGGCPSGDWIHYAGMCYKFKLKNGFSGDKYSRQTFDQAEKSCQNLGNEAHLAILPTPFHHAFVTSLVDSDVWIGVVSDSDIGKHFQWANSEPLLYAQWRLLHPTHHEIGPNQDKVATVLHPYYKAGYDYAMIPSVSSIFPGDWEDVAGGVTNTQYSVCSIPASSSLSNKGSYPDKYKLNCPPTYQPYISACYKVITTQILSYNEADEFCKNEGINNNWNENGTAHLASIWNHYEDSFLYSQVFEAFGQQLDAYQSIWFGLSVNDDENNPAFLWDDNLPVDYTSYRHYFTILTEHNRIYIFSIDYQAGFSAVKMIFSISLSFFVKTTLKT